MTRDEVMEGLEVSEEILETLNVTSGDYKYTSAAVAEEDT